MSNSHTHVEGETRETCRVCTPGTDRVELTEDERAQMNCDCAKPYDWDDHVDSCSVPVVESIVAARVQALTAERDKAWADLVTINTAKVAAEAELAALVTALGFDTRDPMIGRTHAERATEMVKRYDDLAAELAAANTRCAELENRLYDARRQRDDLSLSRLNVLRQAEEAWAERDALQATLDRVTALADEADRSERHINGYGYVLLRALRAALTPEGKACACGHRHLQGPGCQAPGLCGCTEPLTPEGKP